MDQSILSSRAIAGMYYARLESNRELAWVDALSNLFLSSQRVEEYAFLGQSPGFREWLGDRQAHGMRTNSLRVESKHYEATLEIAKRDLRRDKTGQIMARVEEFADQSLRHWAKLLSQLINDGETGLCYDGRPYFDTAHSEGSSGVQSNRITVDISAMPTLVHGTTTAPSVEEMQYAILYGITQLLSFLDDQGEPMNETATRFMVQAPLSMFFAASAAAGGQATQAHSVANLSPNVLDRFSVSVMMNPRLTWTDKICVHRLDSPIKGFIRQQESELELKSKAEGSEYEFDFDAWQFGLDSWRGLNYGYWQRSCLVQLI